MDFTMYDFQDLLIKTMEENYNDLFSSEYFYVGKFPR